MQEINLLKKKGGVGVNTVALMHFNGVITDDASNTVSQFSTISWPVNQWAGRSGVRMGGLSSYAWIEKSPKILIPGSSDYTMEMIVTIDANTSAIEQMCLSGHAGQFFDFLVGFPAFNGGKPCWLLSFSINNDRSAILILDAPWLDGKPHHLAVARKSGIITVYMDGVVKGTLPNTIEWGTSGLMVGNYVYSNGYASVKTVIQEVRLSKICRYNGPFTPPVAPFVLD